MRTTLGCLLASTALLAAGCGDGDDPAARAADGDCLARLSVAGEVLDPVGADPAGRRGAPVTADVVGCDGEAVAQVDARPVTRDGELLGYVARGAYPGFYSAGSLVEPVG